MFDRFRASQSVTVYPARVIRTIIGPIPRDVGLNRTSKVTAHPPVSGFEVFVSVGERSGMWWSEMVCG